MSNLHSKRIERKRKPTFNLHSKRVWWKRNPTSTSTHSYVNRRWCTPTHTYESTHIDTHISTHMNTHTNILNAKMC